MGKKNRKSRPQQTSTTKDSGNVTHDEKSTKSISEKLETPPSTTAPKNPKELSEANKLKLAELQKIIQMKTGVKKSQETPSTSSNIGNNVKPSTSCENKTSPKMTLKDLLASMSNVSISDRKKNAGGSSGTDDSLKGELASLLQNPKLEDALRKSTLATDTPLTNKEGLAELMTLLKSSRTDSQKTSTSVNSSSITESLLNSTTKAGAKTSHESEEASGICNVCQKETNTKCTGCRKVFYCSKSCQKDHWSNHKDVCRLYKVGKIEGFGKILIATRTINPDEEILREKPFVIGPRPNSENVCLVCCKRISGKYRCTRCNWPLCGENCSKSLLHSPECNASEAAGVKGPESLSDRGYTNVSEIVNAIRCLTAASKDPTKWRTLMDRFGARHNLVQPNSEQFLHHHQDILEPLRVLFRLEMLPGLAKVENATIHSILSVLQVNSLPTQSTYGEFSGLFPMSSLLGHSCVPNTKTKYKGEQLIMVATESITAGSPLTAMFTDILWGTKARSDHLMQSKYFSCSCRRCEDPTELGSYFSALTCPKCPSSQPVLPTKPLAFAAPWACVNCKYQISEDELLESNLTLGSEAAELLQCPTVESLEKLLEKWLKRVHTNHYHLHAVKHSLLQLYAVEDMKEEDKDEKYWIEINKKENTCQEFLKVCSLLDPSMAHSVPQFGLAFYELHKCVLEGGKRNFGLAKIGIQQLKKQMQLAKALLRRSMDILRDEDEDTPEGQLYSKCENDFISIGKYMMAVGLM